VFFEQFLGDKTDVIPHDTTSFSLHFLRFTSKSCRFKPNPNQNGASSDYWTIL